MRVDGRKQKSMGGSRQVAPIGDVFYWLPVTLNRKQSQTTSLTSASTFRLSSRLKFIGSSTRSEGAGGCKAAEVTKDKERSFVGQYDGYAGAKKYLHAFHSKSDVVFFLFCVENIVVDFQDDSYT